MKKLYPKVPSVFAFLLFFTHAIPTLAVNHGKTKPLIEADQLAQIRQHIEFSEYFIRWQNSEGIYQSPNRKNSLYASYTGQEINIAPSGKVQEQWSFSLTVKSVKADGRSVYKPTDNPLVIIDDNTIQFNHDNQFIVEYVNNEQGIRQNFIIQQQPAAYTQKLSIQLQPSAGWETLKQNATSLSFKNQQQQLTYNDLKVWDAKGRKLPARFSVHNNLVEINVDAENAVYPVTIDPLVANGTPQNANTFLQSNQVSALMGYSVSSAGDVNGDGYDDVILSALYYDNGQTDEGAAFVYYGSSRGINPTTYTLLEGNISAGGFGSSVSGAGDVDGDGYDDVIVGASHTPLGSLTNAGAIYVFYGSASGIKNTTPDIVQGTYQNDYLGENVSGAGDVNGDGYDDLMAGAWNASRGQANEGIVYIYYGGPWGILYTASSMLEGNIANLSFGSDVSSAGDVNVDGYDDVVIGAVDYNSGGAAYIYYGSSGGVELSPATILESSVQSSSFGLKVAGAGDINSDGYPDLLVGAMSYTNGQSLEGAVFVYHGSPTGINSIPNTILESNQDSAFYGSSVASAGDVNGDGFNDIIIGARTASNGQHGEGMAFVYYGRASGINPIPASTMQSNQQSAIMGMSVSGAGDVNGDGYSDVIVGAPFYTNGQVAEGAGLIFHGGLASAGITASEVLSESSFAPVPLASASVKTFPNPVVNNLSVQFEGLDANSTTYIQVLNVQGFLIQTIQAGKVERGNLSIDISKQLPGLYFVIVQNGSKIFREKIIKQ